MPKGTRIFAVSPSELPFPFGHEPAMTIIPNLLVTGILAIIFGLFIVIWAAVFVPKKNGGAVLFLLSIILLLVGGGFCFAPEFLDSELSVFMQQLRAQGAAGELGRG